MPFIDKALIASVGFLVVLALALVLVVESHPLVPHVGAPHPADSVGAIFYDGRFTCSGSEINLPNGGKAFLTARHCVIDEHFKLHAGKRTVSFSNNELGPFYKADLLALGLDDDIALLKLVNDQDVPALDLVSEKLEQPNAPIYNISFPLDAGKTQFYGNFIAARFAHVPFFFEEYPEWHETMPMAMTIAHGSSGSPVFNKFGQVIGIAVGTFGEGNFNIAEPTTRAWAIATYPESYTWALFQKFHPPTEDDDFDF
ncbi:MAG: serine protease [Acidobacteriia bacterium]|nr:serine protease [Terriglobia bacterium]